VPAIMFVAASNRTREGMTHMRKPGFI
jgi:hypothetical protein